MAATASNAVQSRPKPWEIFDLLPALLRFVGAVWTIESVQKIKYSSDGWQIDLWILMREEVLEDARRIFILEDDLRQKLGTFPFEVNDVPLSEVPERNLPPAELLLER